MIPCRRIKPHFLLEAIASDEVKRFHLPRALASPPNALLAPHHQTEETDPAASPPAPSPGPERESLSSMGTHEARAKTNTAMNITVRMTRGFLASPSACRTFTFVLPPCPLAVPRCHDLTVTNLVNPGWCRPQAAFRQMHPGTLRRPERSSQYWVLPTRSQCRSRFPECEPRFTCRAHPPHTTPSPHPYPP